MGFSDPLASEDGCSLNASIELAANLVYLATHTEGNPNQQRQYLERAAEVLFAMRNHPHLRE